MRYGGIFCDNLGDYPMLLEELSELADGETGADLVDTFELAVQ